MKSPKRSFNVAGPCFPDMHYMVDPIERSREILTAIEEGEYFTLHAADNQARQLCLRHFKGT